MMFDAIIKGILEAFMAQGTGWLVAALFLIGIIVLSKKNDKMQTICDGVRTASENAVKDQFEKRLSEFRVLVDALNRSTEALASMRSSVEARTEAVNQLVAGFAVLTRDLEAHQERWGERATAWHNQLDDIRKRLEDLQRRAP